MLPNSRLLCTLIAASLCVTGCGRNRHAPIAQAPDVAPASQPVDVEPLVMDSSQLKPLHREILAIDLDTALRTAAADNLDVQTARQRVVEFRGRLESVVGGVFPAIVPSAVFDHVEGSVRAIQGNIVGAGFNTFTPTIAVQWVLNPGNVIYDIIAARRRLQAVKANEQAVTQDTMRLTAIRYYDLALAQYRVAVAHQSELEARELLRINRLRADTGTGVPVDVMRAEARLSQTQQELVSALDAFYQASVALAVALRLDATVTLAPRLEELPPIALVDANIPLETLIELAVAYRPDLKHVRLLVEASAAAKGSTWWGAFGPQFQLTYQYGGIMGKSNNTTPKEGIPNNLILNPASPAGTFSANPFANGLIREGIARASVAGADARDERAGMRDQQRMGASAGWRFSLSAIGDLRAAGAVKEQAIVEAERTLDQVKAQVVVARQTSLAQRELMTLSQQQTRAAAETLRLSQANLQAGTMTTLDVLQAQDALDQARLRHAEAVVRYNQSQVNLLAALGAIVPPRSTASEEFGNSMASHPSSVYTPRTSTE